MKFALKRKKMQPQKTLHQDLITLCLMKLFPSELSKQEHRAPRNNQHNEMRLKIGERALSSGQVTIAQLTGTEFSQMLQEKGLSGQNTLFYWKMWSLQGMRKRKHQIGGGVLDVSSCRVLGMQKPLLHLALACAHGEEYL